jgi:hypothetical protein
MNGRQPTLIDILQPRHFAANPARTKVTRTIVQPEIDEFEKNLAKGAGTGGGKSLARSRSAARRRC